VSEQRQTNAGNTQAASQYVPATAREQDAIYQNGKRVATVLNAELDWEAKEIRFGEVYDSDFLMLPDECEFQKYKILIQRIAYATKVEKSAVHKGRTLRGVVADILGCLEQ
jgi:hypothetical protein